MTINRRAVIAALSLSVFLAGSLHAAPKHRSHHSHHSWNGTWSGKWGNQDSEATSITIVNNKVVSYQYRGATTPVSASTVTPTTVSYGTDVTVIIKRTGASTATASLHSAMGDATAELKRQ
jgi:hypothetical protein